MPFFIQPWMVDAFVEKEYGADARYIVTGPSGIIDEVRFVVARTDHPPDAIGLKLVKHEEGSATLLVMRGIGSDWDGVPVTVKAEEPTP